MSPKTERRRKYYDIIRIKRLNIEIPAEHNTRNLHLRAIFPRGQNVFEKKKRRRIKNKETKKKAFHETKVPENKRPVSIDKEHEER